MLFCCIQPLAAQCFLPKHVVQLSSFNVAIWGQQLGSKGNCHSFSLTSFPLRAVSPVPFAAGFWLAQKTSSIFDDLLTANDCHQLVLTAHCPRPIWLQRMRRRILDIAADKNKSISSRPINSPNINSPRGTCLRRVRSNAEGKGCLLC